LNNHIVNFYLNKKGQNKNNKELLSLYSDFFKEVSSFFYDFHNYPDKQKKAVDELNYFNGLLNKINKVESTRFKLTQQDFPNWMNEKIQWDKIE
jgi:hypothetical protein